MNINATKYSFYENDGPHLKYVETTKPQKHECDHHICNCTKVVIEKPKTRLLSRKVCVDASLTKGKYNIEIDLSNGRYTFKWDDKHAYFTMLYDEIYKCYSTKGISIELYKEGWSSVDYLFSTMFLGPHVNISNLMNGHAPSRIVDLNNFRRDDIWLHGCNCGREAYYILGNYNEKENWRRTIETSANIKNWLSIFRPEAEYSVQEIKTKVENEKHFKDAVDFCVDFFIYVLDNIESTDFYKLTSRIRDEIKEKLV